MKVRALSLLPSIGCKRQSGAHVLGCYTRSQQRCRGQALLHASRQAGCRGAGAPALHSTSASRCGCKASSQTHAQRPPSRLPRPGVKRSRPNVCQFVDDGLESGDLNNMTSRRARVNYHCGCLPGTSEKSAVIWTQTVAPSCPTGRTLVPYACRAVVAGQVSQPPRICSWSRNKT